MSEEQTQEQTQEPEQKIESLKNDDSYIKSLREKAARAEAKVKEYEKAHKEREEAEALKKGEYEKLLAQEKANAAKLEQEKTEISERAKMRVLKRELRAQAAQAGILDIDDVDLIDLKKAEFDDDGEPTNAEELIAAFKAKKPAKFKAEKQEVPEEKPKKPVSAPRPAAHEKPAMRSALDMTDDEYRAELARIKGRS